jgi:hypothetical protein
MLQKADGQLTAWNAPSQGGFGFTAATARLGLRDGAAFAALFQRFMARMGEQLRSKAAVRAAGERLRRRDGYLESFRHGEHTVHWLDVLDDDLPFPLSWSAGTGALTLSLTPQSLRATLDACDAPNPDHSLARLPGVNRRGSATVLVQFDAAALVTHGYPLLPMLVQAGGSEWQRDGFDFDAADVPRLAALQPHLGRELLLFGPAAGGFAFRRSGTLPVVDPLTVALASALGYALADL